MPSESITFNGIDASTGNYLLSGLLPGDIAKIAKGEQLDADHIRDLKHRHALQTEAVMGVKAGIDPVSLAETGWGIIFAQEDGERTVALREALRDLLDYRRQQAGDRYREYIGPDAYRPNESKNLFLARHGAAPGPADPEKVPYYLLLVASPEAIPFRFQYQLSVQYAVGRLHFEALEDYASYARSVIAAESQEEVRNKAAFFGVANPDDPATRQSCTNLVQPLAKEIARDKLDWSVESTLAEESQKAKLVDILHSNNRPSLLFTASHGIGFPNGHPRQVSHQGALLCQDWPGPLVWQKGQPIPPEHYFSCDDVSKDADLTGLLCFHFACYGAGTPQKDDFAHRAFRERTDIAPHAFVAGLPQRLLSQPRGAALAVIGHVERAWGYSFLWENTGPQLATFYGTLMRLMLGMPVGHALEYFSEKYAELSTMLSAELEDLKFGKRIDDLALAQLWTAHNDARSYIIIGDPAARLSV